MRPSSREITTAAAVLIAVGLTACAASIFAEDLGLGREVGEGTFGLKRAGLLVFGALMAGLGVLLAVPSRSTRWERMRRYPLDPPPRHSAYLTISLLAVLGLVLVWTRLVGVDESLWHDEVVTIMDYSARGLGPILLGEGPYSINNHVLYNLLSWATTGVLVKTEAVYRLWSVVPAIAAIGAATWWAWRRLGAIVAVAFAALAIAAPMHMDLAPQARGYGLALLGATLMLIAADRLTRAYSNRTLVGFAAAGVVGIWTLHVFALAFVGQAVALLRWPRLRRPVLVAVGAAGLLSLLFYAPVLVDLLRESRPRGETISFGAALVLDRPREWIVAPITAVVTGEEAARRTSLVALVLIAVAIIGLWRRGNGGLALLLVLPLLFFNLFISVAGLTTVSRHQFLLLTHLLLLVAIGIGELGRAVAGYRPLRPVALAAGVVAVIALARATVQWEAGLRPFENFKEAAEVVERTGEDTVVTDSYLPQGLRYYLGDALVELPAEYVEALLCDRRREFVYVRHIPHAADSPLAASYRRPASLDCLAERSAARVRVPQRGRGGGIDVWIVESRRAGRSTIADDLETAPDPE